MSDVIGESDTPRPQLCTHITGLWSITSQYYIRIIYSNEVMCTVNLHILYGKVTLNFTVDVDTHLLQNTSEELQTLH